MNTVENFDQLNTSTAEWIGLYKQDSSVLIEEDDALEAKAQFLIARCHQILAEIRNKMDSMPFPSSK